jgi:hypothetical protein
MRASTLIALLGDALCLLADESPSPCTQPDLQRSLSTYTTRAAGLTSCATSCTLPTPGSPEPTSRNWVIPRFFRQVADGPAEERPVLPRGRPHRRPGC